MAAAAAAAIAAKHRKEAEGKHGKVKRSRTVVIEEPVVILPPPPRPTGWRKYQPAAVWLYNHLFVQVFVAGLIGMNFVANIVQAQIDPTGTKHAAAFGGFDLFFNVVFLFELILNMYSSWLCDFWKSGWNIFDFNVVVIGWLFQLQVPLPGPMKLLRMMRAFRVFRLFKRVPSLRKILNSLAKAVPGVMNAFLIQLIVMCIYAIIGVDRFQYYGEGGFFYNELGEKIELVTGRQQDYGFEYFGDFGKSLYTMFQVLTGESWSEAICRPLFHSSEFTTSMGSAFFFVSFVILNAVVLINVVVAVLLEKMVDEPAMTEEGAPKEDPVQENVDKTAVEVASLREQLDNIMAVSAGMQQGLADVDNIKEQLAVLLEASGIKVAYRAPAPAPAGLADAARGDDPTNGYHLSPQPPSMISADLGQPSSPPTEPSSLDVKAPPFAVQARVDEVVTAAPPVQVGVVAIAAPPESPLHPLGTPLEAS